MLAVRMLSEAYAKKRADLKDDAILIVDGGEHARPTYIMVGGRPPELVIGHRRVWAVFAPPDSQEPIATFFAQVDAERWADANWPHQSRVAEIDSADSPKVQVAVAALIVHEGKVLFGRLKNTGEYVLPEGSIVVGETLESATQRAAKVSAGVDVGKISVSKTAPYVNTLLPRGHQHFITLCMACAYAGGEPKALDPSWDFCGWFPADQPPKPLFVTVQQIIWLAKKASEEREADRRAKHRPTKKRRHDAGLKRQTDAVRRPR